MPGTVTQGAEPPSAPELAATRRTIVKFLS